MTTRPAYTSHAATCLAAACLAAINHEVGSGDVAVHDACRPQLVQHFNGRNDQLDHDKKGTKDSRAARVVVGSRSCGFLTLASPGPHPRPDPYPHPRQSLSSVHTPCSNRSHLKQHLMPLALLELQVQLEGPNIMVQRSTLHGRLHHVRSRPSFVTARVRAYGYALLHAPSCSARVPTVLKRP